MASNESNSVSKSSQTNLEDMADALRINPFLAQKSNKKVVELSKKSCDNVKEENKQVDKIEEPKIVPKPLQRFVEKMSEPSLEACYPMDNKKRGICLIIEHDTFSPNLQLSNRKGSEVDLHATNEVFTQLGFEVHIHKNLNYADVTQLLDQTASLVDHSDSDCFALVLLSHGNMGTVYAYDCPYPTQKLWEPFTADKAPSLAGKPKLFFLQACQGSEMDKGVAVLKATSSDAAFASYKIPIHSDFLIAHSTITGFYSWRNTSQGSWFIQSLIQVIVQEDASKRDLLSLLTQVSNRVANEYESSSSRRDFNFKKQTPFFYSTLTLKLYFDPKN